MESEDFVVDKYREAVSRLTNIVEKYREAVSRLTNGTLDVDSLQYYQNIICQEPYFAYRFACSIPGADLKFCQKYGCKDPHIAYFFALDFPELSITPCLQAVKGTKYEELIRAIIMERACE